MSTARYTPAMSIGGKDARPDRRVRTLTSPVTGRPATDILLGTAEDVDAAVNAARAALPELAALELDGRMRLCERSAEAIENRADEIADVLTLVHGKPRHSEAIEEVRGAATAFRQAGAAARWMVETHYPLSVPGKRLITRRRPRGVYGILTPWNFPVGLASIYYLGPGLAVGNAIVWVGAPTTTAAHRMLLDTILPLWPAGAVNLVTGDGPVVGQALAAHPGVNGIGFTGSTPGGLAVARTAAGKPIALELGGNGPTIVLEDADISLAATRIASGSFSNAGQICTSTGRVLAHESVASELAEALGAQADRIVVGDPFNPQTSMGPVHLADLAERVLGQIDAAVSAGGTLVRGGQRIEAPTPQYLTPTVIDNVPPDSALHREETFGPVAPVVHFSDTAELWNLIRASPFGLHAGIFSRDVERAIGLAEQLPVGHVNVNDTSAYWEWSIPAGGASGAASGVGRTGGPASVEEMSELFSMTVEAGGGR